LQHADIGFAVLPEYENFGYAYEAAKAILKYGKIYLKLHPILGVTTAENLRSRKLHIKSVCGKSTRSNRRIVL